jgi:hypothetical protein
MNSRQKLTSSTVLAENRKFATGSAYELDYLSDPETVKPLPTQKEQKCQKAQF